MKPRKYAPPSPRKTRPKGKFHTRKPRVADASEAAIRKIGISCTCKATRASDNAIKVAIMPARPFIPSIIFRAWVQPPTAIMVKSSEMGQKPRTQSAQLTPTRDTPPSNHQAIAADRKAASKRFREPTSLVMSSTRPATNTGMAARNKTGHSQVSVILLGPRTSKPAKLPATTARPPTRGVGREWDAWGLLRSLSPVRRPCQRSEATISPPTIKATTQIYNQVRDPPI